MGSPTHNRLGSVIMPWVKKVGGDGHIKSNLKRSKWSAVLLSVMRVMSIESYENSMADLSINPPSRSLVGKVAIVTGAGCEGDGIGNGRAISMLLADDGCDVICLDRNLSWAETTAGMINSNPGRGKAIAAQGDVTLATDCEKAVQVALGKFGRLDVLINNVGIAGASGTAVDVDMEQWARSLEVNVSSMVLMVKYAVPAMARNEGELKGSIVNLGSVAGLKGGTPHLLYPTSKGAVVNMTRAMAAHHAKQGIRVNCVCPGASTKESTSILRLMFCRCSTRL